MIDYRKFPIFHLWTRYANCNMASVPTISEMKCSKTKDMCLYTVRWTFSTWEWTTCQCMEYESGRASQREPPVHIGCKWEIWWLIVDQTSQFMTVNEWEWTKGNNHNAVPKMLLVKERCLAEVISIQCFIFTILLKGFKSNHISHVSRPTLAMNSSLKTQITHKLCHCAVSHWVSMFLLWFLLNLLLSLESTRSKLLM